METEPAEISTDADRSGQRPSHQAAKSEAMRAAILDTAVNRLAETGYHATSIKKIAAEGAFSIGAVQHHFPTKEDLMVAVAERALKRGESYLLRGVEKHGIAGLPVLVEKSWVGQINSPWYQAMLEVFVAARTDGGLRERLSPAIRAYSQEAEGRVSALAAGQNADPGDLARIKFLITASRCLLGGFLVQDALAMPKADIEAFIDQWAAFLRSELEEKRHG